MTLWPGGVCGVRVRGEKKPNNPSMRHTYRQNTRAGAPPTVRCTLAAVPCVAPGGCRRVTLHPPFCLTHTRRLLGLEVRPTEHRGCGLFALRPLRRGDVLVPYLGRRRPPGRGGRGDGATPYTVALSPGGTVDAACLRGLGAFANTADDGRGPFNARLSQATLPVDARARRLLFRCRAEDGRLRLHRTAPLAVRRRWVRIPEALVDACAGVSHPWLVATRDIAPGQEILIPYRSPGNRAMVHDTRPSLCP